MFSINCWVTAFLSVSGDDADTAFLYLKAVVPQVKSIHGAFFWYNDASVKLEKLLRESTGSETQISGVEYAIRFLCLLAEKKHFRHIDPLMERIEQTLDEQKGIFNVILETASPKSSPEGSPEGGPPDDYENKLTQMLKEKTGAAEIKIKTYIKPDLLGGYIMRTGSSYIDVSLKGQIKKMKNDLERTVRSGGI
jgi:F0F1-type ATP synthase delta subunit